MPDGTPQSVDDIECRHCGRTRCQVRFPTATGTICYSCHDRQRKRWHLHNNRKRWLREHASSLRQLSRLECDRRLSDELLRWSRSLDRCGLSVSSIVMAACNGALGTENRRTLIAVLRLWARIAWRTERYLLLLAGETPPGVWRERCEESEDENGTD